ncbi:hypothetical protein BJX62DRAFT_217312, partial [Aspergillus germanicus]
MSVRSQRILAPASTAPAPVGLRPRIKRTKVSRACSACQEKRMKCSGGVPCRKCHKNRTECLIDLNTDKRRRTLLKQKIDALEDMITSILETLRNKEKAEWFIAFIRSSASLEEIQRVLARDSRADKSLETNIRPDSPSIQSQDTRGSDLSDIRGLMAIESL